jgi:hypothetical protein
MSPPQAGCGVTCVNFHTSLSGLITLRFILASYRFRRLHSASVGANRFFAKMLNPSALTIAGGTLSVGCPTNCSVANQASLWGRQCITPANSLQVERETVFSVIRRPVASWVGSLGQPPGKRPAVRLCMSGPYGNFRGCKHAGRSTRRPTSNKRIGNTNRSFSGVFGDSPMSRPS